jgi:hypothetical protein
VKDVVSAQWMRLNKSEKFTLDSFFQQNIYDPIFLARINAWNFQFFNLIILIINQVHMKSIMCMCTQLETFRRYQVWYFNKRRNFRSSAVVKGSRGQIIVPTLISRWILIIHERFNLINRQKSCLCRVLINFQLLFFNYFLNLLTVRPFSCVHTEISHNSRPWISFFISSRIRSKICKFYSM